MEKVVISLGGSLIVPDKINIEWLREFKQIIEGMFEKHRFIIICGGGKTARDYQNAAKEIVELDNEDLDWLGIYATRLNAHLLRTVFRESAHPQIIKDPTLEIDFSIK